MYFNIQTAIECTSVYKRPQRVLQYKNGHRVYFSIQTATECTSVYKRLQSVLQYTNGHRVYFNIQTATECSTPTAQRQEEGGRTAPDAGRSQTNELSTPSLTEQRAKPTRGGSSLSPVSACCCKFRHRALDRYRHRSKNTGVTRQRAETASTLSQYKLHSRGVTINYIHVESQ